MLMIFLMNSNLQSPPVPTRESYGQKELRVIATAVRQLPELIELRAYLRPLTAS